MSKLYKELASLYHKMYQDVFDYKKEYEFFNKILHQYNCVDILEVGCGSGNLAKYFKSEGYNYIGADLSEEMLKIARKENPNTHFEKRDMRELGFENSFDALLITGRSFAYMTKNEDVIRCLKSVNKALRKGGILIFDNFEAIAIFSNFTTSLEQVFEYDGKKYRRVSKKTMNMETGWTWNWDAIYYIEENGIEREYEKDHSVLRAFTEDELKLFLTLAELTVKEVYREGATITFVAQK
ncbi:MAG: methyltransferase domain-containing protein [Thermosipho sp. (in: Bacteria)]|nr:methyltransferase domain-containing protein [Thermosipho sp. (in: thermotogales)]